jgi:hypothetical protein
MLLFGRVNGRLAIDAVSIRRLGRIEACLWNRRSTNASRDSNDCDNAYLNQVLALGLGDQWLKLRGGEGVDQTSLRDDQ